MCNVCYHFSTYQTFTTDGHNITLQYCKIVYETSVISVISSTAEMGTGRHSGKCRTSPGWKQTWQAEGKWVQRKSNSMVPEVTTGHNKHYRLTHNSKVIWISESKPFATSRLCVDKQLILRQEDMNPLSKVLIPISTWSSQRGNFLSNHFTSWNGCHLAGSSVWLL